MEKIVFTKITAERPLSPAGVICYVDWSEIYGDRKQPTHEARTSDRKVVLAYQLSDGYKLILMGTSLDDPDEYEIKVDDNTLETIGLKACMSLL
jgi:hypothetical protein